MRSHCRHKHVILKCIAIGLSHGVVLREKKTLLPIYITAGPIRTAYFKAWQRRVTSDSKFGFATVRVAGYLIRRDDTGILLDIGKGKSGPVYA